MLVEKTDLTRRSIQTTINFPFYLYVELIEKARTEGISLSEVVRRILLKEFEGKNQEDLEEDL
ncbi:MAG: hypothetical protein ACM3SR_04935 [Ignavibacteriales bacterium]